MKAEHKLEIARNIVSRLSTGRLNDDGLRGATEYLASHLSGDKLDDLEGIVYLGANQTDW